MPALLACEETVPVMREAPSERATAGNAAARPPAAPCTSTCSPSRRWATRVSTDYQRELAEAVDILATAGIATRIYNHQLCVLGRRLWPYALRSISDWKNDYLDICRSCSVRDACGGVFTTSGNRLGQHLRPVP